MRWRWATAVCVGLWLGLAAPPAAGADPSPHGPTPGEDWAYLAWGRLAAPLYDRTASAAWPAWLVAAFPTDGTVPADDPDAWRVGAEAPANTGSLQIEVDRARLAREIILLVRLADAPTASLYLDLYDAQETVVATNLYGNLLAGQGGEVVRRLPIPLAAYPTAVGIRLWRGRGAITVYDSLLYVERAGGCGPSATEGRAGAAGAVGAGAARIAGSVASGAGCAGGRASGFDARVVGLHAGTVYADAGMPHNAHDGLAARVQDGHGPKRDLAAACAVAGNGGTVEVAAGRYQGGVLAPGTKHLILRPVGRVRIE